LKLRVAAPKIDVILTNYNINKEEPLMRNVLRVGRDVKARRARVKELMRLKIDELEMDVKLQLIQELIPLGLMHIAEVLREEVKALTGDRYKRNGTPGHVRWTKQWGSVYIGEQKLPIRYQRVRDRKEGREVELTSYRRLQEPHHIDEGLLTKILLGLSCRRYRDCCETIPEAFSLSPSTVSRRFIRASTKKLKELMDRRLDTRDIVAIIIDGKSFKDDEMIVALGVTVEGRKVLLGFIQAATENASVCKEFLNGLLERGFTIEQGVLCVMDGSKGIRKAVEEVFGIYALIQRCQWHKRENVVDYLPKGRKAAFRELLQRAYEQPTYEGAKGALMRVSRELSLVNESAVRSLEEGLEQTLTLHRLGLFERLGRSLKTTNTIESIMALIGQRTDKVDYWRNSNQKQRWLATALLDIEPRLNRIRGYGYLPELRIAIQMELGIKAQEVIAA
jgi:putative transposase